MTLKEALRNSQGKIYYGMHFYPGVAQYDPPDQDSFKVFINESTIRQMSPSFAGRPVFVEHVDEVDDDLTQLRNEADGWVIESFYNEADGKTWAKFIIVSDRGFSAIRKGFRLSNAYIPQLSDTRATWNGVDYQKVVTGGEFEHLAIVNNPRYDESVIMTPEEFKMYNEKLKVELKRLANSQDTKGENKMAFKLFKRTKVENSTDIEGMMIEMPLSKKEMSITKVINEYDKILNMNGYAANEHMVKLNDKEEMSVGDLVKKHQELTNKMAEYEKQEDGGEPKKGKGDNPELDNEEDMENSEEGEDKESMDNAEAIVDETADTDVGDRGGDMSVGSKFEKKDQINKDAVRKSLSNAKAKAAALKNAHLNAIDDTPYVKVDLAEDQVARGKSRYGSN